MDLSRIERARAGVLRSHQGQAAKTRSAARRAFAGISWLAVVAHAESVETSATDVRNRHPARDRNRPFPARAARHGGSLRTDGKARIAIVRADPLGRTDHRTG